MENGGTEVGKIVYKVELDSDALNHDIDYVSQQLEKLPDAKNINISSGDIVGQWAQAQAEIDRVSQSILYLTQGLGDASTKASDVSMTIAQIMSEFRNGGGDIDAVVQRISSLGEAAGIDSNGQLLNGLYELRDRAEELSAELEQLTEGTAEYSAKNAELAQVSIELQNSLHSLDASYKPLYTNLQSYTKAVQEAKNATEQFDSTSASASQSIPNVARSIGTIMASFATFKRSVSLVTDSLSEYIEAQNKLASMNGGQYISPLAQSWKELNSAVTTTKYSLASVFEKFAPIISSIAEFISSHQRLITGLLAGTTTFAAVAGVVGVLTAALKVLGMQSLITRGMIGGLIGVVGTLAASLVALGAASAASETNAEGYTAAEQLQLETLKANRKALQDQVSELKNTSSATTSAAKAARDYADQLSKLRRNYLESLKQIEVNHNQTIADIRADLEELRNDYENTISERNAKFAVTLAEEAKNHQELVDELTGQLNFLQRYNNEYNAEKLTRTEVALEKAERLYKEETEKRQKEIDLQNEADEKAYAKRKEELEKELNTELAFMEKHRQDLYQVREVTLLDEIDQLKRSYREQEAALNETLSNRMASISASTGSVGKQINKLVKEIKDLNREIEIATSKGIKLDPYDELSLSLNRSLNPNATVWTTGDGTVKLVSGRALGGYTGFGPKYEVAGIVHRGEYVVPKEDVDQESGLPNAMGGNQYITINLEGTFATSSQERRKVAQQIADALAQLNKAGRTTTWA